MSLSRAEPEDDAAHESHHSESSYGPFLPRRFAARRALLAVTAGLLLSGCSHKPYTLSDADRERFKAGIIRVAPAGESDPLIEGLSDCAVYKAEVAREEIVGWKKVLGADWGAAYPGFLTACTQQSIKFDGKYVYVRLCAQAIGAGGGCANGGAYRSHDGEHRWQYARNAVSWKPLRP